MNFIKRHWRIIFPIFFVIIIWCFSAANGDQSATTSGLWASRLHINEGLLRKLAHIFLYAGLGYSISSYQKGVHPLIYPKRSLVVIAALITAAYGAFDEVHQLIVAGRSGQGTDILLDAVAGIGGVLLYITIFCFWRTVFSAKLKQKFVH